jgi:hypothetical protein
VNRIFDFVLSIHTVYRFLILFCSFIIKDSTTVVVVDMADSRAVSAVVE